MIDRSNPEPAPVPRDAIRTRDWVWGLLAAVVVGVPVPLLLVTVLLGSARCGTRPAAGYGDADRATSCASPR
jgi:hypothetical protein